LIFRGIRNIWKPPVYHGSIRMRGYFEGWYYKFVDKIEQTVIALIPGVSFDSNGTNSHAFIQFLDNSEGFSNYFRFGIEDFSFSQDKPEIKIGDNFFSPSKIKVNVQNNNLSINGVLQFQNIKPWPITCFSPGAMGWYAFVPFMQCYHGVLSFDHSIDGKLLINSKTVDFTGGRGYIEKDWGHSFPSYHIWLQTNHFDQTGISLMVSIANIPWLGRYFDGFLIGFLYGGHLYKFTTYTGARITVFRYDHNSLWLHVGSDNYRIEIEVKYARGAQLRSPIRGEMQGRLSETLAAETLVRFYRVSKDTESFIFRGFGRHTGLEIEGNIPENLKP